MGSAQALEWRGDVFEEHAKGVRLARIDWTMAGQRGFQIQESVRQYEENRPYSVRGAEAVYIYFDDKICQFVKCFGCVLRSRAGSV